MYRREIEMMRTAVEEGAFHIEFQILDDVEAQICAVHEYRCTAFISHFVYRQTVFCSIIKFFRSVSVWNKLSGKIETVADSQMLIEGKPCVVAYAESTTVVITS